VLRARNLHEFDNLVTAPLHGFRDCDDYWRRASSKPLLASVAVPTLVLNPATTPSCPPATCPARPTSRRRCCSNNRPKAATSASSAALARPAGLAAAALVRFFTETGKA
jgi:predicted alpha/beta-fold hydrolase